MTIPDLSRAQWRTSSYSSGNGQCVEVAAWRTASHSSGNGACVEVGGAGPTVAVRDSKDPEGPVLTFGPREWQRFAARLKAGTLIPA